MKGLIAPLIICVSCSMAIGLGFIKYIENSDQEKEEALIKRQEKIESNYAPQVMDQRELEQHEELWHNSLEYIYLERMKQVIK